MTFPKDNWYWPPKSIIFPNSCWFSGLGQPQYRRCNLNVVVDQLKWRFMSRSDSEEVFHARKEGCGEGRISGGPGWCWQPQAVVTCARLSPPAEQPGHRSHCSAGSPNASILIEPPTSEWKALVIKISISVLKTAPCSFPECMAVTPGSVSTAPRFCCVRGKIWASQERLSPD